MNAIQAIVDQSNYEINGSFLNYQIDGYWLDEKLEELFPDSRFAGIVPTLLPWMVIEKEKEIVWNRIYPKLHEKTICPVLMCPDDCDFSCTLIVAEIENSGEHIYWNKLGLDQTNTHISGQIGTEVEWFTNIGPFMFDSLEYAKMLSDFKKLMQ